MAQFKDAWAAHQRKRWLCPDAHRWLVQDCARFAAPQRFERKFDPDQPRVPAGNSDGGQWTGEDTQVDSVAEDTADLDAVPRMRFAQGEVGALVGQAIVHVGRGGGKDCFYKFSYGIVALRQMANFACAQTVPWFAATHGRLIKMSIGGDLV